MADVAKAVETAEVAVETVAPVLATGELEWKKVAIVAGGVVVITGCAIGGRYFYKKYKAKKAAESETVINPEMEGEPVVKTKKK